jgi:hypothetical protein
VKKNKCQRGNDQQHRQIDEILRMQYQPKDIKAPFSQIEQNGLPVIPL